MPDVNVTSYLLAIIGFLIVFVLNGIKKDISDMKTSLHDISSALWSEVSEMKQRIVIIETRCNLHHDDTK